MTNEEREQLEYEVLKILQSRTDNYRIFLENTTNHAFRVITLLFTVLSLVALVSSSILVFTFGRSRQELMTYYEREISSMVATFKVDEKTRDLISNQIADRIGSEETEQTVNHLLDERVQEITRQRTGEMLNEALTRKVNELTDRDFRRNLLPPWTILMSYADPANLPPGWVICDGSNGTPDLREYQFTKYEPGVGDATSVKAYAQTDNLEVIFIMKPPACGDDVVNQPEEQCDGQDGVPLGCKCVTGCILDCSDEINVNQ